MYPYRGGIKQNFKVKGGIYILDTIVIGAGPAGLTAALYALRYGLSVAVFEKNMYGGQMALTNNIENYPGFKKTQGPDLSSRMYEQVIDLGCEFVPEEVVKVDLKGKKKCIETEKNKFYAKSLIVANGLKRRKLKISGEDEFSGKGVSYCATCDGTFFKNKDVAVIGGGNVALEDAIFLSKICKTVYLLVRKNSFKADQYLVDLVDNIKNIKKFMRSKIIKILGDRSVDKILVDHEGKSHYFDVSGIFVAIGYEPDNEIFYGQIDTDENGYFLSNDLCETCIPGVYIAGDCKKKDLRQIVTATSDGAIAGNQAAKYVFSLSKSSQLEVARV